MNYKKRIPDNTFYAYDVNVPIFKVASVPTSETNHATIMNGSLAELNIISINTQISNNPTLFEDVTQTEWETRASEILLVFQQNL
jgi:hypothetical protein